MTADGEHVLTMGAAMKFDARGLWMIRCSCGWLGPIGTGGSVRSAGTAHVRDKEKSA